MKRDCNLTGHITGADENKQSQQKGIQKCLSLKDEYYAYKWQNSKNGRNSPRYKLLEVKLA